MNRFFAQFFLFIFLFSALVPIQIREELGKIPQLVLHYQAHHAVEPSLTIGAFLHEHYGAGFTQHQSAHDHSNLPGKDTAHHTHTISCANTLVAMLETGLHIAIPTVTHTMGRAFFRAAQLRPSQHLSCIWQPPKAC